MALTADGGSSTTIDVISSSSGDTSVESLDTSDSTSGTTLVQEGSGTTTVGSTAVDRSVTHAGTFVPRGTTTVLQSVGLLTRLRNQSYAFIDSFAASAIDGNWSQTAGNGALAQADDLISISFGTGVEATAEAASPGEPRVALEHSFGNSYTAILHISSVTSITTPSAGSVLAGMTHVTTAHSNGGVTGGFGVYFERDSAGSNFIRSARWSSATATLDDQFALSAQTTDIWLMLIASGDPVEPRAYYRTSAPNQGDDTFTLLGEITTGLASLALAEFRLVAWEDQNSDGAIQGNFHRLDIFPNLGPG